MLCVSFETSNADFSSASLCHVTGSLFLLMCRLNDFFLSVLGQGEMCHQNEPADHQLGRAECCGQ